MEARSPSLAFWVAYALSLASMAMCPVKFERLPAPRRPPTNWDIPPIRPLEQSPVQPHGLTRMSPVNESGVCCHSATRVPQIVIPENSLRSYRFRSLPHPEARFIAVFPPPNCGVMHSFTCLNTFGGYVRKHGRGTAVRVPGHLTDIGRGYV